MIFIGHFSTITVLNEIWTYVDYKLTVFSIILVVINHATARALCYFETDVYFLVVLVKKRIYHLKGTVSKKKNSEITLDIKKDTFHVSFFFSKIA